MLYLIDSSAVLNDFGFQFGDDNDYVTTPLVVAEFKDMRSRNLMENALHSRLLSIQDPSEENLRYVEEITAEKGFRKLSKPDLSLLALALDLKKESKEFLLLTDDYSIQNFCSVLKIPFEGVMRGEITKEISFSLECSACGKTLPSFSKERKCPVCGSSLRRKRREKSS